MKGVDQSAIAFNPNGPEQQRSRCPHCSKRTRDDSLSINIAMGVFLCHRCGLRGKLDGLHSAPASREFTPQRLSEIAGFKRSRLTRVWTEASAVGTSSPRAFHAYLKGRGLLAVLRSRVTDFRTHPSLEYFDHGRLIGRFPALLSLYRDASGRPLTIHVTYLKNEGSGKADVANPKKMLPASRSGATKGGAIRLFDLKGHVLGLAEGIENALSLHLLKGIPVWAAYCAGNLESVVVPNTIREIQIAVDVDASARGQRASWALADRMRTTNPNVRVHYVLPDLDGPGDLNDELRRSAE